AFIEVFHLLLASKDSALRPVGLLWPLLTSPPLSRCIAAAVVRCGGPERRSPQVRLGFFSRARRIYPSASGWLLGVAVACRLPHAEKASYPLPVRRIRDFVVGFLQIPLAEGTLA